MKNYRFIGDNSLELTDEMRKTEDIALARFKIYIDGNEFDTGEPENFDQPRLVAAMKKSNQAIRTACPSPQEYVDLIGDEGDAFIVTISEKLSGSYQSAVMAKDMLLEKDSSRKIHVFDSKSASVGETLVYLKIKELIENGLSFENIVSKTSEFIDGMKTYFVLNSLDNLIKNGRISRIKGFFGSILHFSPIMCGTDGEIGLLENIRGRKKSLQRLIEVIGETVDKMEDKILAISHTNAEEVGESIAEEIRKKYNFKDVLLFRTNDLSTVYADDGGIIICF